MAGTLRGDTNSIPDCASTCTVAIESGAVLVFDQDFDGSHASIISGAGALQKSGSGTLTLTATNSITGPTTISGGTLHLPSTGTLGGSVAVGAGTVLRGSGTVIGALTASGRVEPGDSIGTLTVRGNATFEASSTLAIEASGDTGAHDQLSAAKTVTVRPGATLNLLLDDSDNFRQGVRIDNVVVGGEPIDGGVNFSIAPSLFFLDATIDATNPNALSIDIGRNGRTFGSVSQNDNQAATGAILDAAEASGAATPFDNVVNTLINQSTATTAPLALDAMAGPSHTALDSARLTTAVQFRDNIVRRFGYRGRDAEALASRSDALPVFALHRPSLRARPAMAPLAFADAGSAATGSKGSERGLAGWLDGYGVFANVDADANAAGYDYSVAGTTLGIDWRPSEEVLVGGALGYAHTALDFDAHDAFTSGDTIQTALYAAYTRERVHAGGLVRYAHGDYSSARSIAEGGFDARAKASLYGDEAGAFVEGGVVVAEFRGIRLQPMASFDYLHLWRSSFSERGADVLDLLVGSTEIDSMVLSAGARAHTEFEFQRDYIIAPELWVRWGHEFGDTEREIVAALRGAPNAPFTVVGVEAARDSVHLGGGWSVRGPNDLNLFIHYDAAINTAYTIHAIRAGALVAF